MFNSMVSAVRRRIMDATPSWKGFIHAQSWTRRAARSENEQLAGGVLSGHQEQIRWLPVGSSKGMVVPTGCDRRWQRVPRTADVRMFPGHKSGSHGHRWLGTVGRRTSHVGSFSASRAIGGMCRPKESFTAHESCTLNSFATLCLFPMKLNASPTLTQPGEFIRKNFLSDFFQIPETGPTTIPWPLPS